MMIDTIKNLCTPSQVYFVINFLIITFIILTGKLKEKIEKNKIKKLSKNINFIILVIIVLSILFLTTVTFILNYMCDLGYVNLVGAFVFIYLLYRAYKLKKLFS